MTDTDIGSAPLDEEELAALAERLETLPIEHVDWVLRLYLECRRARGAEASLLADGCRTADADDTTQVVLDTADWLRTLWEVGYMGGESLPAPPRSDFPEINVEDILKSALFSRIRRGKHPLPFPPPTRDGTPWHEVVETDGPFTVRAEVFADGGCNVEGCPEWRIVTADETAQRYRIQHRGKGPLYTLTLAADGHGRLERCPAEIHRRILRQSRAGIVAYLLEWPAEDGATRQVPLRATSWERAEAEALRWVALRHPDLYGQIQFEHSER